MPKGVWDRGPMMERRRLMKEAQSGKVVYHSPTILEDEGKIDRRIRERFEVVERLTLSVISGESKAMIISGPPGLGKSYSVEQLLNEYDPTGSQYLISKGYIRPSSLYSLLYQFKDEGQILVFDDSDSVFLDEVSLNLLKAACDTTETRMISYRSESVKVTDDGEAVPSMFEYQGSILFITNYDFDGMIKAGSKLAPHLQALMSRAHYLNLGMRNNHDYYVRVKQVASEGLFKMNDNKHLDDETIHDLLVYIKTNMNNLREISIRMAVKIAILAHGNPNDWQKLADLTCLRENLD